MLMKDDLRPHSAQHNSDWMHGPLRWSVADATAREALVVAADDVTGRKLLLQQDDGSLWMATGTSTPKFTRLDPQTVLRFYASTWGNTGGGAISPHPVAVGTTLAATAQMVERDLRIYAFEYKAAGAAPTQQHVCTLTVDGVDSALVLTINAAVTTLVVTGTVDVPARSFVGIRHAAGTPENTQSDAKFLIHANRRAG